MASDDAGRRAAELVRVEYVGGEARHLWFVRALGFVVADGLDDTNARRLAAAWRERLAEVIREESARAMERGARAVRGGGR
jgi:hypothetical protein